MNTRTIPTATHLKPTTWLPQQRQSDRELTPLDLLVTLAAAATIAAAVLLCR